MTAPVDFRQLLRDYGSAMQRAALEPSGSEYEQRWIDQANTLYFQIVNLIQRYQAVTDAARDVVAPTTTTDNPLGLLRYSLVRLDRVEYTVTEPALPAPELDDTQPIDVYAINAALEEKPRKGWGTSWL